MSVRAKVVSPGSRPGSPQLRTGKLRFGAGPNAVFLGIFHGEYDGLLIDADSGNRIAGAEQQFASLIDVLALLDPSTDPLDKHIVADEHWQCGIPPKLVSERRRRDLSPFQRRPIPDIGGRIRLVFRCAQLMELAQGTDNLLLPRPWPLGSRMDFQRAMREINGRPRKPVP